MQILVFPFYSINFPSNQYCNALLCLQLNNRIHLIAFKHFLQVIFQKYFIIILKNKSELQIQIKLVRYFMQAIQIIACWQQIYNLQDSKLSFYIVSSYAILVFQGLSVLLLYSFLFYCRQSQESRCWKWICKGLYFYFCHLDDIDVNENGLQTIELDKI